MFARIAVTVFAAALFSAAAAQKKDAATLPLAPAAQSIEITLRPRWSEGARHFEVTVAFDAAGRAQTPLRLPDEWAGADALHRGISNLRATSKDAQLSNGTTPAERVVRHPASGRVTLTYELIDFGNNSFSRSRLYQPQLERDYALFFGYGAWVLPAWDKQQPVDVQIAIDGLPPGWSAASSFGAVSGPGEVRWSERGLHAGLLRHTVFAFGDFRLHRADIKGRPVWIALRGRHPFTDSVFVDRTTRLIAAHRAFFNDFDAPHLLLTLMPNGITNGSSYGGTAVYRAFAMHVSADFTVPGPGFDFLVAHEHLHEWIPRRFGTTEAPGAKDEALRYWFSEGFTNWMTHRLLLQSGLWSLADYVKALDDLVRRYETSGARSRINAEIPGQFFTDNDIGQLPYQRGELLALHWDARLAANGASLAQVLRGLLLPPPPYKERQPLATDRLLSALEKRLGPGVRGDVDRLIERAERFDYTPDFGGPCLLARQARIDQYELGFADESFKRGQVTGLVAGSAAERAGLREGDLMKGWSVYGGDTSRDVKLQVERNGKVAEISYRPVSARTTMGARFEVKPGAADDPACRAWIAMQ